MFVDDAFTGQLRIVAPGRAKRLGPRPEGCPFCAGNEEHTPPEIARLDDAGQTWRARAVPNLFPLSDVHEVLIPTPRHATSLRELDAEEWRNGMELWLLRLAAHRELVGGDRYVHLFVNDGRPAGASLEHTHAQLVAVPRVAQVEQLTAHVREPASCAACARVRGQDELWIAEQDGWVICAHPSPRTGGGLLVVHQEHLGGLDAEHGAGLAAALQRAVTALEEGPFNLWLVTDPRYSSHVYVELVPRTAIPAGVELALGAGVSTADPLLTAQAARERLSVGTAAAAD